MSDKDAKDPREITPGIPEPYAISIMKMIAKNPGSRYTDTKQAYEEFVQIGLVCPRCGFKSPESARFCQDCGCSLQKMIRDQFRDKSPEELWARAFQLNSVQQYSEAIRFCDEAIRLQPDFARAHQTKGFALSNLERYDEALESYRKALESLGDETQEANIHTNMSFIYMEQGDQEKWLEEIQEALECDPNHYKARQLLEKYRSEQA